MALGKIKVDDDQLAGAQLSKAEKKRLRRQEKKLKKFGIRDESKMNKVEKFFYNIQKRRRIKKRKRVSRSFIGDAALFLLLCAFGAFSAYPLVEAMANEGNPNSVSDAGVGALCIRTAVQGAYLNVKINASGIKDRTIADAILAEAAQIAADADQKEKEILETVNKVIG